MDERTIDLYERTRRGENLCPTCGRPMKMYYQPWCPICEPPKLESEPVLNLIQALECLEAVGHEGIKERLWGILCEFAINDTAFWLDFDAVDFLGLIDDQYVVDLEVLRIVFELPQKVLMFTSW